MAEEMMIALAVIALLGGYLIGYSVALWEHGIKFDKRGRRL
jgi:hypothetical protein